MIFLLLCIFFIVGLIAGTISGLLGVGGGIILVPVQVFIYNQIGIPEELEIKLALGTSLATVFLNTLISSRAQAKRKSISWHLLYKIGVGVVLGSILGVYLATILPSNVLEIFFGSLVLFIGAYFIFRGKSHPHKEFFVPNYGIINCIGFGIGSIATMLGTGGGYLTVPTLLYLGMPIRLAIGTSSAIGALLSFMGTLAFMIPAFVKTIYLYSLGYIYLPAFIPLALGGIIAAPFGVHLTHTIPTEHLKKLFSIGLIFIGLYMILR